MRRNAINWLKTWKARKGHKPLIIHGIRQVGKTWLMKEFGRTHYKNVAYIWFEKNPKMQELFSVDMDVRRILTGLELETGQRITPGDTLIIFDEIQACPDALTSLKYFNENAPEYDIIAVGSLLGINLHHGSSLPSVGQRKEIISSSPSATNATFPVGKVEFMNLYPLTFSEFLLAIGEEKLDELIKSRDFQLIKVFKEKLILNLKMYFYVGGMPEAVLEFSKNRDFNAVRKIQNDILISYGNDFSKHIPANELQKVNQIWDSIPSQLAKENKKFIFKELKYKATMSIYEFALAWLESCGLVHKVTRIHKAALPIKSYKNPNFFKLYLCDIGLLSCMSVLDAKTILEGDAVFTDYKGALTEQFVCQELKTLSDAEIAYWSNDSATAEVDFILQLGSKIMPVEVKAGINLKAKSLMVYREKFHPKTEIRTSLADFKKTDNLYDIPLYTLDELPGIVSV